MVKLGASGATGLRGSEHAATTSVPTSVPTSVMRDVFIGHLRLTRCPGSSARGRAWRYQPQDDAAGKNSLSGVIRSLHGAMLFDEAVFDCVADDSGVGVEVELVQDARAVRAHGLGTHAQLRGDVLERLPRAEQAQHLVLAVRQSRVSRALPPPLLGER